MGIDRPGRPVGRGSRGLLSRLARVVPAVPTFSVDDGFRYSVPDHIELEVGSIVRVPLGGRRVRGFVVATSEGDASGLRAIIARSGGRSVFAPRLLEVLTWAAHHYVAPLSVLLERAAPPNLPPTASSDFPTLAPPPGASPTRSRRPTYLLGPAWPPTWLEPLAGPVLSNGGSVVVVLATGAEAASLANHAAAWARKLVLEVGPDLDDADLTAKWALAAGEPGRLVIGTPRVVLWPVAALHGMVVVEEGRRAMKERQTPTLHVRDVARTRAAVEHHSVAFIGPTPSSELVAAGVEIVRRPGRKRVWPLVEVVDRSADPPGSGLVGPQARAALRAVAERRGRSLVFTHRPGYAPASRCVRCRQVRRCSSCGARPDPGPTCRRCGAELGPCTSCGGAVFEPLGAGVGRVAEELQRVLGGERVATLPGRSAVMVGSEADLAGLGPIDLAVVVDADGLLLAPNYRAGEEALRILARIAGLLGAGPGRRMMVQTSIPDHAVMDALRRGEPMRYLSSELGSRAALGYPPLGELLVLEVRGSGPIDPGGKFEALVSSPVRLLGPAPGPRGRRWLVQGPELGNFKLALRPVVQQLRDAGHTVRIDADPIDL